MIKTARINLRVEPSQPVQDVLLDQCLFRLNETDFNTFEAALNEPLPVNNKLAKLLSEPSPWE